MSYSWTLLWVALTAVLWKHSFGPEVLGLSLWGSFGGEEGTIGGRLGLGYLGPILDACSPFDLPCVHMRIKEKDIHCKLVWC